VGTSKQSPNQPNPATATAARNVRNRRAGSRWQSELRNGLREAGLDVERLVLAGKEDEGSTEDSTPLG
jgi:hypothetical protein